MPEPLVSIVIPTFNDDPDHLRMSIGSALDQTYSNTEVIVVDDGSTRAESVAVLDGFEGVRLVRQPNGGTSHAANTGIRAAEGEFILRLDGDDWIQADSVELLVKAMVDGSSSGVVGAFPSVVRFGAATGELRSSPVVRLADIAVTNQVVSTCLYRRSLWEASGGYDEGDAAPEDWLMWMWVLGSTGGHFVQVGDAVLHYRAREGSRNSRFPDIATAHSRILEIAPELAGPLYMAAAERGLSLTRENAALQAFHDAWAPRVAPLRGVRTMLRSLRGAR